MKNNVEKMPYLRNLNQATVNARAKLQTAQSNYTRLLKQRDDLIAKGREYIHRSKLAENEGLYEKGQALLAESNQVNTKMLRALQDYKDAEESLSKMENI
jgi:hypothetical protein